MLRSKTKLTKERGKKTQTHTQRLRARKIYTISSSLSLWCAGFSFIHILSVLLWKSVHGRHSVSLITVKPLSCFRSESKWDMKKSKSSLSYFHRRLTVTHAFECQPVLLFIVTTNIFDSFSRFRFFVHICSFQIWLPRVGCLIFDATLYPIQHTCMHTVYVTQFLVIPSNWLYEMRMWRKKKQRMEIKHRNFSRFMWWTFH